MKKAGWMVLLAMGVGFLTSCPAKINCFHCTTRIMEKETMEVAHFSEVYCGDQREIELANTFEDEVYLYSTKCR